MNSNSHHANAQAQAALVLQFGTSAAANKRYPLDRDAMVIGKCRNCDLVLEAPDISTIHCVVTRTAGGYAIRDCDSRAGIRLNGDRVKDATLHDQDLVQLGPFSFRVAIPPAPSGKFRRDLPARLLRLERKRNNLARLALSLRRRLREEQSAKRTSAADAAAAAKLAQQADELRRRLRDCEQRADELDAAERALAGDRASLTREMEEFQQQRALSEQELEQNHRELQRQCAQRQAQLEALQRQQAELEESFRQRQSALEEEFSGRRRQLEHDFEQWRNGLAQQLRQPAAPAADDGPDLDEQDLEKTQPLPMLNGVLGRISLLDSDEEDEQRRLLIRRRELDFFSQHLRRTQERLNQQQSQPADQPLDEDSSENDMAQTQPLPTPTIDRAASELFQRQQAALQRAEELLEEQRAAMAEMLAEFRRVGGQPQQNAEPDPDLEAILRENAELRRLLEERTEPAAPEANNDDGAAARELEQLRSQNDLLQRLLDEKNLELEQARQAGSSGIADMPAVEDVDSYEAELVQFRRQMELERSELNKEREQLRYKNEELDDATREVEMQLSRERAEMARERMRLDRMREEIQADLERLQRNGGVMERLAPVKKLREEIVESRQKPGSTPVPPRSNGLSGNLTNLRNR